MIEHLYRYAKEWFTLANSEDVIRCIFEIQRRYAEAELESGVILKITPVTTDDLITLYLRLMNDLNTVNYRVYMSNPLNIYPDWDRDILDIHQK